MQPPPHHEPLVASDLLESLWCQDALGVMLAGVQVLGTEVQFFLAQFACNRGAVLVLQGRWAGFKSLQLKVENERKLWTPTRYGARRSHVYGPPQDRGPEGHTSKFNTGSAAAQAPGSTQCR